MPGVAPGYQLRAATHADYDFLFGLHVATMKALVTQVWGWDEAFQRAHFREHFDPARSKVVVVDGHDVGAISVDRRPGELYIANVELLPAFQGRGIGAALIRDVLEEAAREGLSVGLQVLHANRAARLYERLGFREVGRTETHRHMRAEPLGGGRVAPGGSTGPSPPAGRLPAVKLGLGLTMQFERGQSLEQQVRERIEQVE